MRSDAPVSPLSPLSPVSRIASLLVSLLASLAATAAAQPHTTPLLSIADARFSQARLYRVDQSGQTDIVHVFRFLVRPDSFTLHHDNRTLVLHSTNPDAVVLFDAARGSVIRTLHSGDPFGNVFAVRPWHTGDYLVADSGASAPGGTFVRIVAADGSGLRSVFARPEWHNQVRALAQDLSTGRILAGLIQIAPQSGPGLIRIDPETGGFEALDPAPRNVVSLVQDHRDGAILYGEYTGGIHRRAPDGKITTLVPANHPLGIEASSLTFDRATGNGILIAGGGRSIARIAFAPGGPATVVAVHDKLPLLSMVAKDLAFERGENLIPVRRGKGLWSFELDFAGEGGAPFLLALSATGFTPGIALGSVTVPLVADGLFGASISGGLAPWLHGNIGTLDQEGSGRVTLDLRGLPGRLAGVRIWVAALTARPGKPPAIATVSRPRVVILD